MARYKFGKQTQLIPFQDFKSLTEKARLNTEKTGYVWLLYYSGCRKSEAYELTVKDCQVTEESFNVDLQRKKHGAHVDPLTLPRSWPGIEQLVTLYEKAKVRQPIKKRIFYQEEKTTRSRIVKACWLFPHIQAATAWRLIKEILGKEYYPHFLRLNRLSELGSDPEANLVRLKDYSGIQSIHTLQSYLGTSKEERKKAISWMEKKMNAQN